MQSLSPVLVINPNTSSTVTDHLLRHLSANLPQAQIQGITAAFGAPYIADEYSYCIAGHAVLDAWERAQAAAPAPGFAAVLVGCFGDPGWHALREVTQVPVLGLAQASLRSMAEQGHARVAVVTGGEKWQGMLERWVRANGLSANITQVLALPANGAQMMQSRDAALVQLAQACQSALRDGQTQAVLLGGAGLAGMGARLRAHYDLPVWDCVEAVCWQMAQALAVAAPVSLTAALSAK